MCCCCDGDAEEDTKLAKERVCTDLVAFVLFICFIFGGIVVAVFSLMNGRAAKLANGYDSYGNVCGTKNPTILNSTESGRDLTDRSKVLFFDPSLITQTDEICVSRCPEEDIDDMAAFARWAQRYESSLCSYEIPLRDIIANKVDKRDFNLRGPCPKLPLKRTKKFLNRCLPVGAAQSSGIIATLNQLDTLKLIISDFYTGRVLILYLCLIAFLLCILMVVFVRFIVSCLVWVILILSMLLSIGGTAFLWFQFATYKTELDEAGQANSGILSLTICSERAFFVYSIVATILTVVLLVLIIFMRKKLQIVVAMFKVAAKVFASMPCLLALPFLTYIVLLAFWSLWSVIFVLLSSSDVLLDRPKGSGVATTTTAEPISTPVPASTTLNPDAVVYKEILYEPATVTYFWWYHVFVLLWLSEFFLALQQIVISGAVATWYFTRDRKNLGCVILKSFCNAVRYHLGSVALGALIIALVRLPRYILMYIHEKTKGAENACAKFCLKCCICCLWCVEKCLRYLNKNAYTIIAIRGTTSFCDSARRAFLTLVSNAALVAALNSVGDFVLFLCKVIVMCATLIIGLFLFRDDPDLNYFFVPVLIVSALAYFIAHCFLSIYETVVDSLLLCYCDDIQGSDPTDPDPEKRPFAPVELAQFIENGDAELRKVEGVKTRALASRANDYAAQEESNA